MPTWSKGTSNRMHTTGSKQQTTKSPERLQQQQNPRQDKVQYKQQSRPSHLVSFHSPTPTTTTTVHHPHPPPSHILQTHIPYPKPNSASLFLVVRSPSIREFSRTSYRSSMAVHQSWAYQVEDRVWWLTDSACCARSNLVPASPPGGLSLEDEDGEVRDWV